MSIKDYNKLDITYTVIICSLAKIMLGYVVFIFGYDFLNANKFFTDAKTIYSLYNSFSSIGELFRFSINDSFGNTARLYRIIFFNLNLSFNEFVFFNTVLYVLIFFFLVYAVKIKYNKDIFVFFCAFYVFDIIFLYIPSKDIFNLLLTILFLKLLINRSRYSYMIIFLLYGLYSLFFRKYYIIILIAFYFLLLLSRINFVKKMLVIIFTISVFSFIFMKTRLFDDIIYLRYYSTLVLGGYTNTLISDVFQQIPGQKNILLFVLNYFINLVRIVIPIEVLWKSLSRGIIYVPLQLATNLLILLYIKVVSNFYKFKTITTIQKTVKIKEYYIIKNIVVYIVSFYMVSALFEPDFGSFFRHSTSLLPFLFYLLFSVDIRSILRTFKMGEICNSRVK